jgi:hypothetical protein
VVDDELLRQAAGCLVVGMCEDDSEVEEHWIYLCHSSTNCTRLLWDAVCIAWDALCIAWDAVCIACVRRTYV